MITQEIFNQYCSDFQKKYLKAKKNIIATTELGPLLIRPIEEEIEKVAQTECHEGCSYCCHLRVVAFPHEIIAIYLHLNKSSQTGILKEIKEKTNSQFNLIKNLSVNEHFSINVECPLLVNNRCIAYHVRPIACAGHHSGSENNCKTSYESPEVLGTEKGGIPMIYSIKEEQSTQTQVTLQVIQENKDDGYQYELISALHSIFKDPSIIQKWKRGRKFIK